jgi:hypothetical protein
MYCGAVSWISQTCKLVQTRLCSRIGKKVAARRRSYSTQQRAGEYAFAVQTNAFKFGRGVIERELGYTAKELGIKRVALYTGFSIHSMFN